MRIEPSEDQPRGGANSRVLRFCVMSAGEAEAIYRRADATAKGINLVSQAVTAHGGSEAASLRVAEQVCMPFWSALPNKRLCASIYPGVAGLATSAMRQYMGRTLFLMATLSDIRCSGKRASSMVQASTKSAKSLETETIQAMIGSSGARAVLERFWADR